MLPEEAFCQKYIGTASFESLRTFATSKGLSPSDFYDACTSTKLLVDSHGASKQTAINNLRNFLSNTYNFRLAQKEAIRRKAAERAEEARQKALDEARIKALKNPPAPERKSMEASKVEFERRRRFDFSKE